MRGDLLGLVLASQPGLGAGFELGRENPNDPSVPALNLLQLGGEGAVKRMLSPAPVFKTSGNAENTGNVDVPKPSGTVEGDLLIAFGMIFDNATATLAPPLGWTLISGPDRGVGGLEMAVYTWYKIAGASEPSTYQFIPSPTQYCYIFSLRFTGHDPNNPIDADIKPNAAFTATRTGLSINTVSPNDLLILVSAGPNSFANTPPPGMTQLVTVANVRSLYAETIATPGATGERAHANDVQDAWVTQMFAIRAQNKAPSRAQAGAAG